MAITQIERENLINDVLSAIKTNSRTIDQLTPVTGLGASDYFEINGGKKVSYAVLKELMSGLSDEEKRVILDRIDDQAKTLGLHEAQIKELRVRLTSLENASELEGYHFNILPQTLPSSIKGQWTAAVGTKMTSRYTEIHESEPVRIPDGLETLVLRANADEAVIHEASQESSGPDGLRVLTFLDADQTVLLSLYSGYPQSGLPGNVRRIADPTYYQCPMIDDAVYVVLGWTGAITPILTGLYREGENPNDQLAKDLQELKETVNKLQTSAGDAQFIGEKLTLEELDTFGEDGTFGASLEAVRVNPVCRFRVFLPSEEKYPIGFLDVLTDKGGITQVLTTHRLLDADGRISESSETDTDIHVWFRTLPPMSRTWSEWRPLKTEPDIEALSEEDIDEIFESLK